MAKFSDIIKSKSLVLVDFHATWCGPCKMLAPILKQVKANLKDKVKIVKIDIDKHQNLAGQLNVRGVPTMILYKNGEQVWRQSGVVQSQEIERIIREQI
ncbi:MAG: thioredoxin [Crocinitomicaceae bacterium]